MSETSADFLSPEERDDAPGLQGLLDRLTADQFRSWYREREWRENIKNNQPYFNGPGTVPDPERHSPSQILQCHRKIHYRQENAPAESPDPRGIFWFGTRFEEDLLYPFLDRDVTHAGTYVQNSIWVDFNVDTPVGELQIKGSTDPVIVDEDARPLLPTEVKTKSTVDNVTEPNPHHRAQLHAYLAGLSEKFERDLTDGVLVYGGRDDLGLKTFHVEFDEKFWRDTVIDWVTTHTKYRKADELPPDNPEYDWECRFCSYRVRCGKADTPHQNQGPRGLVEGYGGYPREKVIKYLDGHPEESLTPTLARKYPDLIERYGVTDWYCSKCSSLVEWDEVDPDGDPQCPHCADRNKLSSLSLGREK